MHYKRRTGTFWFKCFECGQYKCKWYQTLCPFCARGGDGQ